MLSRFSCVRCFSSSWTIARQAPLSMGFSRQEYWSGLPFPSPGDLPNPGIEPATLRSPALADGFFTTSATWESHVYTHRNTHTHTHTHTSLQGKKIQGIIKIIFGHKGLLGNFPGSPAVKTPSLHCRRHGFNPWLENIYSVSRMVWPKILINKNLAPTVQHTELYSKLSNDLHQKRS